MPDESSITAAITALCHHDTYQSGCALCDWRRRAMAEHLADIGTRLVMGEEDDDAT